LCKSRPGRRRRRTTTNEAPKSSDRETPTNASDIGLDSSGTRLVVPSFVVPHPERCSGARQQQQPSCSTNQIKNNNIVIVVSRHDP
jgi:hypothetical protein